MKKLKYLLIALGMLTGALLPVLEAGLHFADTAALDENLNPLWGLDIPDSGIFIAQIIIYSFVGGGIVWLVFAVFKRFGGFRH